MRLNLPVVVAAAFILAACSTASDDAADSGSSGDSTTTPPTSGQQAAVNTTTGEPPGSPLDFQKNIGDRVFFDFDKSTLRPNGRTTIERWAAWLKTYPANKVLVEGHADERGTREYNLALGERRANASREYLISLGIDPNRVRTISYGKERPDIPGSNENAYARNRRGVAVIEASTN